MKRGTVDDAELIAALVDRLGGGRLEPRELAGVLEGAGFRLELKGTITRPGTSAHLQAWRGEARAELEREPARAARCECYTVKRSARGWSSKGGDRCEGKSIVAAIVRRDFRGLPRFLFVCGRHLRAHGIAPADLLGIIHLTPAELARPLDLHREREATAERRRREEDAAREVRALRVECPTCHAPAESRCGGRGGLHAAAHYDRLLAGDRLVDAAAAGGAP